MKIIKDNIYYIISGIGIISFYFITRLYNIMNLPIFTDEAIYTRWAQIAHNDAAWRFISLTDGKQPSFMWAHAIFLSFIEDPLLAGRLVSVATGFVSMLGIFLLAQLIFKNKKISLIASFLYAIFPFALVYDRMAIYESILAMFFIWALYFQIILVRKLRPDIAMVLGFVLGGGVLTKSSGFIAIYLMPLLFVLLDFSKKVFYKKALRLALLLVVSIIIANAMYSVLRLSPFFHIIEEKNTIFVYPVGEWLAFDFETKVSNFISNIKGLGDWFVIYFSIPFIVSLFLSFVFKNNLKEKLLLLAWFFLPFLALTVIGKTLYPRYLFFMTVPLLPLVAFGFYKTCEKFKNKIVTICLTIALIAYPLFANYYILNDFANAPIPRIDLQQYIKGWPAGGGVEESIEFFRKEAESKEIFIGTEGTFGLMPYSYEIFINENPNIEIKGYWPIRENPPEELEDIAMEKEVYFVFYQPCPGCEYPGDAPDSWPIEKVKEYKKGNSENTLSIYKLITN